MVSIVMPCYNQANYIEEAINSVKQQNYNNWECIIVNDGSSDNSAEIIRNLITNDSRFKLLDIENGGVSNARNTAINISSGEYILPLDGDDKIHPKYLELAIQQFKNDPSTTLVYCNAKYFGAKNKLWDLPTYTYEFLFHGNCIFCSAIYKREDFNAKTTGYDTKMIHGYEDWEFWLQLLNKDSNVVKLSETLFSYRIKEVSRNTEVLESNKLEFTLKYIYGKHFNSFFKKLGGNVNNNTNPGGEFIHFLKEKNLRIDTPNADSNGNEIYLQSERFKKIKKTVSYKLFVKLELSLKKKFKR